jgi:hypothetical protein
LGRKSAGSSFSIKERRFETAADGGVDTAAPWEGKTEANYALTMTLIQCVVFVAVIVLAAVGKEKRGIGF